MGDRLYSISPANPFDLVQNGQIYSKSTACWRLAAGVDILQTNPLRRQQIPVWCGFSLIHLFSLKRLVTLTDG
jgi:hypothetical protein